jgi:hypothetical protein
VHDGASVTPVTDASARKHGLAALTRAENCGVDDHFSALAAMFGIANPEGMDGLVDQDSQLRVRRLVFVDHDSPRLLIAPPAGLAGNRLERDREPERLGERTHRRQQMRVRVPRQWLARRAQRSLLAPLDRVDLRAVKHEHGLEQQSCLAVLLAAELVTVLNRQRSDDRDRALTLLDAIPELQPRLEPGDERCIGTRQGDEQLV